jgi:hypothetical protein
MGWPDGYTVGVADFLDETVNTEALEEPGHLSTVLLG